MNIQEIKGIVMRLHAHLKYPQANMVWYGQLDSLLNELDNARGK